MNSEIVAFKKQLKDKGTKGLVIDLDETLSNTIHYWALELAKSFGNPQNLSTEEIIKRIYAQDVPFWKPEELQNWMILALKSEEMTEVYPIVEGSDQAVEKINQVIPVAGYLTIRETCIRDATRRWLKKHGFPDEPVITRPDELKTGGHQWKAEVLVYLYPQVIGLIDDTPDIINYLPNSYKGAIFLYGNRDYPRTGLNIIPWATWDDVYKKVVEHQASLERTAGNPI